MVVVIFSNCLLLSPHIHWFSLHWGSNYSNRLWPSAVCRPRKSTLTGLRGVSTAVYHYRWLSSRPPQPDESAPIQSAIWVVFSVPHTLMTRPGQDLSFVRMFFLILGNLQQKEDWGWCMALRERGNVLWSLQVEMGLKWSTRQWFVILLIRFGGDPLPLCMENR